MLRGAKSNELRMAALGFPVFRYRLAAFVIAGAFGGLAGILLANEGAYISPAMMSWVKSGDLIVMVVLGGIGALLRAALRRHRLLRAGGIAEAAASTSCTRAGANTGRSCSARCWC